MQGAGVLDRREAWRWHYRADAARRAGIVLIGTAGLATATAATWMYDVRVAPFAGWVAVPVDAVGALFLVLGLLELRRPAGQRMGLLLVAVAFTWYLGYLQLSAIPVVFEL